MSPATATSAQFRRGLISAAEAAAAARDELGRLDAAGGDGDLGVTLEKGFHLVRTALEQSKNGSRDDTRLMGELLSRHAPSTLGTLLGTALSTAAAALPDSSPVTGGEMAGFLSAVSRSIAEMGSVQPGQRTILDALQPSADAARAAVEASPDLAGVLDAACQAAEAGAVATSGMTPTAGRARWSPAAAAGSVDGGARAWAIWLRGFSTGVTPTSSEASWNT